MKKTIFIVLVFVAGCGEAAKTSHINRAFLDSLEAGEVKIMYTTKVISDPPGARIELDDDYIGDAPLEIEWEVWSDLIFVRDHELRALPIYQGHSTQTKYFSGSDDGKYKELYDTVPKTILFDMRLGPIPRRYEIDLD
ncbi:MAG: hypothetical protein GY845_24100 [Planctomycetes bacterium]|nr:hypothetical protein [Planctomycetota bacterium]